MKNKQDVPGESFYESTLKSEGLGVVEVDKPYSSVDIKQIGGKWAKLDALYNDIKPGSAGFMSNSPVTANATATKIRKHGSKELYADSNGDYLGDNVWDNLILSFTGTPKEAEIADRRRASICGLDKWNRPIGLKIPRRYREPGKEWRKRIYRHILGDVAMGRNHEYSRYQPTQPPYARFDGGNGPLSIVDPYKPPYEWVISSEAAWEHEEYDDSPDREDAVRMSPVVDTMHYLPGRGPYQRSLSTKSNSDITG